MAVHSAENLADAVDACNRCRLRLAAVDQQGTRSHRRTRMPSVVIAERTIHYHAVVGCRAERRHGAAGPPDAIAATSRGRGARRSRTDTPGPATFPLELETSEKGTGLGQRIAEIHEVQFAVVNPDPKFPIQRECRSAGPGAGLRPRRPGAPPIPQWGPSAPGRRGRNPTPPAAPPTPTRAGNFGSRLTGLLRMHLSVGSFRLVHRLVRGVVP
jgi:hypothetical protein